MRIALVCPGGMGGSAVAACELAIRLAREGHDVHVIAFRRPLRLPAAQAGVTFHPVDVPSFPSLRYPPATMALATAIARVVRLHRVDLVHVHYAVPHAFAAVVARHMLPEGHRVPVVATLQGTDVTQIARDPAVADALAWSLRGCDAVTAVSAELRRLAEEYLQLRGVRTIPNFVDPQAVRRSPDPALRRELAGPDELVLVHASSFRPVKRAADVVRVFAGVAAERPARLLLLGEGPDLPAVRRLAAELGVLSRIRFLGSRADVPRFLSVADVALLTSETEGCSLAILEAMACEVPVVATRAGGTPEVVVDGVTGFLHPVGDVPGMVRSCLRLVDPGLRQELGRAARARVLACFSADGVVPQYERLYRATLGARS